MIFRDEETRRAWDALHRQPATAIPGAVRARLGELGGRSVLHVACGRGRATAELLELGAQVTAVDDDEKAVAEARERASAAAFLVADLGALPFELRRSRFDVVFTERAERVSDIAGVASSLRSGGRLILLRSHPAGDCVDPIDLRWREDYFAQQTAGALVAACVEAGLTVTELLETVSQPPWLRLDRRIPGLLAVIATKQ